MSKSAERHVRRGIQEVLLKIGEVGKRERVKKSAHSDSIPVIFGITGPIFARAPKSPHPLELSPRGHHDWPVMPFIRPESSASIHGTSCANSR